MKPRLVSSASAALVERVSAALEEARDELPGDFREQPIIDRIVSVIEARSERLTKARSEPSS